MSHNNCFYCCIQNKCIHNTELHNITLVGNLFFIFVVVAKSRVFENITKLVVSYYPNTKIY